MWKDTHGVSQCPAVRAVLASTADVQMLDGGYIIHRALPLQNTGLKGGNGARWLHNAGQRSAEGGRRKRNDEEDEGKRGNLCP